MAKIVYKPHKLEDMERVGSLIEEGILKEIEIDEAVTKYIRELITPKPYPEVHKGFQKFSEYLEE